MRITRDDIPALALSALLVVTGTLHFLISHRYDEIVPTWLPFAPRFWTIASGFAELAVAIVIARPSSRSLGGFLATLLFIAVFPANVKMAIDWAHRSNLEFAIALIRLPLQLPLIWWGWRLYKGAEDALLDDLVP